jgi:hypothetical protein
MITLQTIKLIQEKYPDAYGIDYEIGDFGKKLYYVYFEDGNDVVGVVIDGEFREVEEYE